MEFQACIFDLDGVIVDTASHHFVAWSRLADELGVPFSKQDNEQLKGVSRVDSLEYILRKGGLILDPPTKIQLMQRKNEHYLAMADGTTPADALPGVISLLEELRSTGIKIALGSSSKNAQLILDRLGIRHYFDAIVDGNHITLSKPDPEVFLMGAKHLDVSPSNCLVFEDAQSGIDSAKTGGFQVIGIGSEENLVGAAAVIPGFQGYNWSKIQALIHTK